VNVRRLAAALSTGLLAVLLTTVPVGLAHAADPLELSLDGTSWSTALPSRLFSSPAVIVPGDVISSALWVRNGSDDLARVDLEVADGLGVTPGTLAGDLSLSIDGTPAAGGSRWHGPVLAPGASVRVGLTVTFAATSDQATRVAVATVLDSVTLVQSAVGTADPPATASPQGVSPPAGVPPEGVAAPRAAPHAATGLASTGADLARVLGVSCSAVGVGILLLLTRRTSRRSEA
jgi:hypothetical protein